MRKIRVTFPSLEVVELQVNYEENDLAMIEMEAARRGISFDGPIATVIEYETIDTDG